MSNCFICPPKTPLFIPAVVVRYAIAETEEMLAFLYKQHSESLETVLQGGDWPEDFEPNDIPLYECMLPELRQGIENGYEEAHWGSKPVVWMMDGLRHVLKKRTDIP